MDADAAFARPLPPVRVDSCSGRGEYALRVGHVWVGAGQVSSRRTQPFRVTGSRVVLHRPVRLLLKTRMWHTWSAHWLAATNLLIGVVLLGAFATPLLAATGAADAAQQLHTWYLVLCPQRPEHSYFVLGQKTALEHREIAIFTAQLAAGLLYALPTWRARSQLGFWSLVVLSLPMAVDVLSQMLGWRDSDWFARSWTGALFGVGSVFWIYPYVDEALGLAPTTSATLGSSSRRLVERAGAPTGRLLPR